MIYFMYQITNLVTGKIYVGVHKSTTLTDNYMGSGKLIKRAIQKHGVDNFRRDILEYFSTSEEMYEREKQIVNEEFVARADTYNITIGGGGGWYYVHKMHGSRDEYINFQRNISPFSGPPRDGVDPEAIRLKAREGFIRNQVPQKIRQWRRDNPEAALSARLAGSKYLNTPESIEKKKATYANIKHQQGSQNSQFGTCWVYSDHLKRCMKVKKVNLDELLQDGWIRGRKQFD